MSAHAYLSYRLPDARCVKLSPWHVNGDTDLTARLRVWAADTSAVIRCRYDVDGAALRSQAGLPMEAALRLHVGWRCPSANTAGAGTTVDLPAERIGGELGLLLEGRLMRERVLVSVRVLLARALPRRPITAWRAGSVLWEPTGPESIPLGAGAEQLRVVPISFKDATCPWPGDALWALDWSPDDLEAPVAGSLCIHLNMDHPAAALVTGDVSSPEARVVRDAMQHDLARLMIHTALAHDEIVHAGRRWPSDSVGEMLERLLRQTFRSMDRRGWPGLQSLLRSDPAALEAEIQAGRKFLSRIGS